MPNDKYFGDHITADMKVALKWLNTKLKEKNPKYQFTKPDSAIALKWKYSDWCLMNMEDENYAWGIVDGEYVEMGSFSIKELQDIELPFGLGIERDLLFRPTNAKKLWDKLKTKNNM